MSDYAFVPVTYGCITEYAWVDDDLADLFLMYRWHAQGGLYAATTALGLMHRFVMDVPKGDPLVVHHRNEDSLDNRRENLEPVDRVVHGMLPHPRRDAADRARRAGTALILPLHARQVALRELEAVAA